MFIFFSPLVNDLFCFVCLRTVHASVNERLLPCTYENACLKEHFTPAGHQPQNPRIISIARKYISNELSTLSTPNHWNFFPVHHFIFISLKMVQFFPYLPLREMNFSGIQVKILWFCFW